MTVDNLIRRHQNMTQMVREFIEEINPKKLKELDELIEKMDNIIKETSELGQ